MVVVKTVQWHCLVLISLDMYKHGIIFTVWLYKPMLTIAICLVIGLALELEFSVWLVSRYAHEFILLSVVNVTVIVTQRWHIYL